MNALAGSVRGGATICCAQREPQELKTGTLWRRYTRELAAAGAKAVRAVVGGNA